MREAEEVSDQRDIIPYPPTTPQLMGENGEILADLAPIMILELQDGSAYQGYAFGAHKNISGELVFQTGRDLDSPVLPVLPQKKTC